MEKVNLFKLSGVLANKLPAANSRCFLLKIFDSSEFFFHPLLCDVANNITSSMFIHLSDLGKNKQAAGTRNS